MNPVERVSVLVPARNEEETLPITLPSILRAAAKLAGPNEVLVIAPDSSPVHTNPPVCHANLRWVPTYDEGKFLALRTGAAAAVGDILILIDADVLVESDAFVHLLRPIVARDADVVAGRIEVLRLARTPVHHLLERWASVSMTAWDAFRKGQPDYLWALPGAIYAIRRGFLPDSLLVPLVDDASIGLQAAENGAAFAYAPDAVVRTPTPSTYQQWMRQKFRSRRGWAALARLRRREVAALESAFRSYLTTAAADEPTSSLMQVQDRAHRLAARASIVLNPSAATAWKPGRGGRQWPRTAITSVSPDRATMDPSVSGEIANG